MDKNVKKKALIKNVMFWSTEIRKDFNISHFKEEPWQFIVELKKVKQKCYRGFSL